MQEQPGDAERLILQLENGCVIMDKKFESQNIVFTKYWSNK